MFDRISRIATVMLDRVISPYEVALIQVATKMARMAVNPQKEDNYVDAINYMAFSAQFAGINMSTAEQEDIAAMGKRYGFDARKELQQPEGPQQDQ